MIERNFKRKRKGGIFVERKERGITLISLVLTIIVMLILVAVSINVAVNGGLFKKSGESVKKTDIAKLMEDWTVTKWANYNTTTGSTDAVGPTLNEVWPDGRYSKYNDMFRINNGELIYIDSNEEIGKYVEELGGIKDKWVQEEDEIRQLSGVNQNTYTIGSLVDYVPNTDSTTSVVSGELSGNSVDQEITREDLSWVILGVDSENQNNILITSSAPTTQKLYLKGAPAYNNGPTIMNTVCKDLYSFKEGENIKYEARSMTIEDVNNCLGIKPSIGCYKDTGDTEKAFGTKPNSTDVYTLKDLADAYYKEGTKTRLEEEMSSVWAAVAVNREDRTFLTPDDTTNSKIKRDGTLNDPNNKLAKYLLNDREYRASEAKNDFVIKDIFDNNKNVKVSKVQKQLIFGNTDNDGVSTGWLPTYWLESFGSHPSAARALVYFGPGRVTHGDCSSCGDYLYSFGDVPCAARSLRPVVSLPVDILPVCGLI